MRSSCRSLAAGAEDMKIQLKPNQSRRFNARFGGAIPRQIENYWEKFEANPHPPS